MRRLRLGFTLIELMIVMAVIGMLLAISVPRYFKNVDKAKESVLRQDLAQIRDGIDKYFEDNGRYPDTLNTLVSKRYLRKIPVDPITDNADTWIIIEPEKKESGGVFDVKSGASGHAKDGSAYDSW